MHVRLKSRGNTLVVSIFGELDHHTVDELRQKVDNEIIKSSTKNVVFDFSHVNFMDSSGIGVIMGRYKNIQCLKGQLAVVCLKPQIKRIFEMSGLSKIIRIYDSLEQAL